MIWSGKNEQEMYETMTKILECPCQILDSRTADRKFVEIYLEERKKGEEEGYIPVLIYLDPFLIGTVADNLAAEAYGGWEEWKKMDTNSFEKGDDERIKTLAENRTLAAGRKCLLESKLPDIPETQTDYSYLEAASREMGVEIMGSYDEGETMDDFKNMLIYSSNQTLVLAKIPAKEPWQVLAWLPIGGWNECPDSSMILSYAKRWYERWGAMPAVIGHDTLQFYTDTPVQDQELALDLAKEQMMFCFTEEMMSLAGSLAKSHVWFFWWD